VLDQNVEVIKQIDHIDAQILSLARKDKSSVGLGGMTSKLNFARLATKMSIEVVIFNMQGEDKIIQAVQGQTGTICVAQTKTVSSRQKWMASGSVIEGLVTIDLGALAAIRNRKSLLAVGAIHIIECFDVGEVVHDA